MAPTFSPLGPRFPLSPSGPLLPCKEENGQSSSANNALLQIYIYTEHLPSPQENP